MEVQLKFPSVYDLWKFKEKVQALNVDVLTGENVLIGAFQKAEVDLARSSFNANVLGQMQVNDVFAGKTE